MWWGWSTFPATSKGKPDDGTRTAGNCRERSDRKDGKPYGRSTPDVEGKPEAPGIGHKPDGDPSGSSSDLRLADRKVCNSSPETGKKRSSDRTAGGFGQRRTRSELGPRPDEERDESPERVEASAKAPSGFSRV